MSLAKLGTAVAVLAGSLLVFTGASGGERNGQWWSTQDRSEKVTYLLGLLDGYRHARLAAAASSPRAERDVALACAPPPEHLAARLAAFDGISAKQLAEAIEALYRDDRNRTIALGDAIELAATQLQGADARIPEARLETLRRAR